MSGWLSPARASARGSGFTLSLSAALFVAALAAYAAGPPSGVAGLPEILRADVRGELHAAPGAALSGAAAAPRGGLNPGASGLWLLMVRAASLLSVKDIVARARIVSALAAALAAALVLARLAGRAGAGDHAGESEHERKAEGEGDPERAGALPGPALIGELLAAIMAAVTVALSRSFFTAAALVGPAAVGAAQALGTLALAERVARCPSDGRAGLGLALLAGLSAGGPPSAALLGWPVGLPLCLWALRRGERWPLLAPAVFVAGAGTSLLIAARAQTGVTLSGLGAQLALLPIIRGLTRGLAQAPAHALILALRELTDELGVLAVLAAAVGGAAMLSARRRPDGDPARALGFTLWPLVVGLALRAAFGRAPDGTVGLIVASSAVALPMAVGVLRLGDRLGKARLPATAAVGVMIAVWPLLAR